MSGNEALDSLDDHQLALILQHLGSDLTGSGAPVNAVADPEAAAAILRAFRATAGGGEQPYGVTPVRDAMRSALDIALGDSTTQALAEDLIADPPEEDQMGVDQLAEYIPTLFFLVAFLQTRFRVRISRVAGRTEAVVEFEKEAAKPEVVDKLVSIAGSVLAGSGDG
jgi:hypothetical protein